MSIVEERVLNVLNTWNNARLKLKDYIENLPKDMDRGEGFFDVELKNLRDKVYEAEAEITSLAVPVKVYQKVVSEFFEDVDHSLLLDLLYQSFDFHFPPPEPNAKESVAGWWFIPLVFWTGKGASDKEIAAYSHSEAEKLDAYILSNFASEISKYPAPREDDSGSFAIVKSTLDLTKMNKKRLPVSRKNSETNNFFHENRPLADKDRDVHAVLIPIRVMASNTEMMFFIRDMISKVLDNYVEEKQEEFDPEFLIGDVSSKQIAVMRGYLYMWNMWSQKILEVPEKTYRHFDFIVTRKKGEPQSVVVNYVDNYFENEEDEVGVEHTYRNVFSSELEDGYMLMDVLAPFIEQSSDVVSFSVINKLERSNQHLKTVSGLFV